MTPRFPSDDEWWGCAVNANDMTGKVQAEGAGQPARIGAMLELNVGALDDVGLARMVVLGLPASAAEALGRVIGRAQVVGPLIPEATLRRAWRERKALSREMSGRLYEVSRVVDAANRSFGDDRAAVDRFLARPHPLLDGMTPLAMAQSGSAGAQAVINLIRRADAGVSV
jgi:putative toxin-antitoxin system antitoxin component (TIGR02293 family)